MQTTLDNSICVRVDESSAPSAPGKRLYFMDVTLPTYAQVGITMQGVVYVNVNDSCVFRLCRAGTLEVRDERKEVQELREAYVDLYNHVFNSRVARRAWAWHKDRLEQTKKSLGQ